MLLYISFFYLLYALHIEKRSSYKGKFKSEDAVITEIDLNGNERVRIGTNLFDTEFNLRIIFQHTLLFEIEVKKAMFYFCKYF